MSLDTCIYVIFGDKGRIPPVKYIFFCIRKNITKLTTAAFLRTYLFVLKVAGSCKTFFHEWHNFFSTINFPNAMLSILNGHNSHISSSRSMFLSSVRLS